MRGFDEDVAPSSNTMSHVLGNQRRYGNSIRGMDHPLMLVIKWKGD